MFLNMILKKNLLQMSYAIAQVLPPPPYSTMPRFETTKHLFSINVCTSVYYMVLILDGSSEHGAHLWNKSGISIC